VDDETNGTSGAGGVFDFRGVHGSYQVTITPPGGLPVLRTFSLEPGEGTSVLTLVLDAPVFAGPANNPNPANGAYGLSFTPNLTWSSGSYATSHRVFFGYSSNAVAAATTNSVEYRGNFVNASFTPGILAPSGRYYWRVDEVLGPNATVERPGPSRPSSARTPPSPWLAAWATATVLSSASPARVVKPTAWRRRTA